MLSTRWSVFKGKRRGARKKKDIWPYPLRKRRRKKVRLIIASLLLPHFRTFVFLSAIPTNSNCFSPSAVSCAAGMQESQATILAVRIQPFVHMTQFRHTNINRAGIFHQTTGSPVQVLHFRPAYSSICRQESVSHFSFHSVASFFRQRRWSHILPYLRVKLTGIIRVGDRKRPLFNTTYVRVQVGYQDQHSTDIDGAKEYFLMSPHLSQSWKLKAIREQSLIVYWIECTSVQMASLQARTFNACEWFFSPPWSSNMKRGLKLSIFPVPPFFYLSTCALFLWSYIFVHSTCYLL